MNEIKICPIGKIVNGSEIKIVPDQKYADSNREFVQERMTEMKVHQMSTDKSCINV